MVLVFAALAGVEDPSGAAFGSYSNTENTTGWDILNIYTNSSYLDEVQVGPLVVC